MKSRQKRITTAIALLLVFATTQVYVGVSFAGPQPAAVRNAGVPPQQPTGSLTTQGNKPITLNGATAIGGATLLSGASIETPDGVSATVNLGALGSLQIDPNTKLTLEFQNGSVKVTVLQGCVTLHTTKGTSGQVDNSQGTAGKSDPAKGGVVKACTPGAVPVVAGAAAGAGGLFGLGTASTVAIVAGAATFVAVPLAARGRNPSPAAP